MIVGEFWIHKDLITKALHPRNPSRISSNGNVSAKHSLVLIKFCQSKCPYPSILRSFCHWLGAESPWAFKDREEGELNWRSLLWVFISTQFLAGTTGISWATLLCRSNSERRSHPSYQQLQPAWLHSSAGAEVRTVPGHNWDFSSWPLLELLCQSPSL